MNDRIIYQSSMDPKTQRMETSFDNEKHVKHRLGRTMMREIEHNTSLNGGRLDEPYQ